MAEKTGKTRSVLLPTALWIVAVVVTLASVVYQRQTGPTYPVRGTASVGGAEVSYNKKPYKLPRSWTVGNDVEVKLHAPDVAVTGHIRYKRLNSFDEWTPAPLARDGDDLLAYLPQLESAGKYLYEVHLTNGDEEFSPTDQGPIVLRFKGSVPAGVLIPHIVLIFAAMLLSNRAFLEALLRRRRAKLYMLLTTLLLLAGGMICGPLVQKYAFGELWTGVPFGWDLTDNKTLIIMLGWIAACIFNIKGKPRHTPIILAALLMFAVYLIPHSVLGSELDYREMPEQPVSQPAD